jgi:hypothetical protein
MMMRWRGHVAQKEEMRNIQNSGWGHQGKDHVGDLGTDGSTVLKC